MLSFFKVLAHLYPYIFLALVICGPVLLLPHTLPVFMFLAVVDSVGTILLGALFTGLCTLHFALPTTFRQMTADAAGRLTS